MTVGFTISKFIIIQSLEPHEAPTGEMLGEYLKSLAEEYAPTLQVVVFKCHSAQEFRNFLIELTDAAAINGERPLLHVECHGSQTDGIEFENGSMLPWDEWGVILSRLNIATRFNLLVAVAACYGAYLNGEYSPLRPSPAFCIVAPTAEIDPADVITGFRVFYLNLLKTGDAGVAAKELEKIRPCSGHWFSQLAEEWFIQLIENYVKTHLNHDAFEAWVRSIFRKLRDTGQTLSIGSLKRRLLRQNREGLAGEYFDTFFCIDQVPEGKIRFGATRAQVKKTVATLRATGRYNV